MSSGKQVTDGVMWRAVYLQHGLYIIVSLFT